jgi:hypothetical protein
MTAALRLGSGSLLLLLVCNVACNDDCDERCDSDYEDCISAARNDEEKRARCESEVDQCRGICGTEPIDFNDER